MWFVNHRARLSVLVVLLVLVAGASAPAQWSSDAALNYAFADRSGEQVIEKIAVTDAGDMYLGWFDHASGNYDVYLQRLDASGNELWAHNGILISDHPQNSWLTDWDLTADSEGNAILVFNDIRSGGDWDIYAYKIAPDGSFVWGPDGIALSDNADFEPSPCVTEAADGDLVFVWSRSPDVGQADLRMQRVAPDGTVLLAPGGQPIVAVAGETPGFPDVVPAAGGSVIVSWVRDISEYLSPRHLHGGKFSPTGAPQWLTNAVVYDAYSLPLGYAPKIMSNGSGGAIFWWHRSDYNLYNSFVQILHGNGSEQFAHNGLAVSTQASRHHISPDLDYNADTGELFVFWNERNSAQSQWGIYGQKIDLFGTRLWGDGGRQLLPVNGEYKGLPRCGCLDDGALVFLLDQPSGVYGQDRIVAMNVDQDGYHRWAGVPLVLASTYSTKGRLVAEVYEGPGVGQGVAFWEDDRQGSVDIFGQNVLPDGSLGADDTAVGSHRYPFGCSLGQNSPNPFSFVTNIGVAAEGSLRGASLHIFDLTGRLVRELAIADLEGSSRTLVWDGRAGSGELLPSGAYFYQVRYAGGGSSLRKAILVK